jgi:hypothetical protein
LLQLYGGCLYSLCVDAVVVLTGMYKIKIAWTSYSYAGVPGWGTIPALALRDLGGSNKSPLYQVSGPKFKRTVSPLWRSII